MQQVRRTLDVSNTSMISREAMLNDFARYSPWMGLALRSFMRDAHNTICFQRTKAILSNPYHLGQGASPIQYT